MERRNAVGPILGSFALFLIIAAALAGCRSVGGPVAPAEVPDPAFCPSAAMATHVESGAAAGSGVRAGRVSLAVREKPKGGRLREVTGVLRPIPMPPQPTTGTITGTVVPSVLAQVGAYVSGTTALVLTVSTDPSTDGFSLANLPPGTYDLEASAPGYVSGWELGVPLAAGETSGGHVLEMTETGGGELKM